LIFKRVDPQFLEIWAGEAGDFEPHQCDVGGKRQVSVNEQGEVVQARYRELVQHYPNLDRLLVARQLRKALDRLVKCASRLDDVIMVGRVIRIERDASGLIDRRNLISHQSIANDRVRSILGWAAPNSPIWLILVCKACGNVQAFRPDLVPEALKRWQQE
jgi:hypothetical protein